MNIDPQNSPAGEHAAFRYALLVLLARDRPSLRFLESALDHDPVLRENHQMRQNIEQLVKEAKNLKAPHPKVLNAEISRDPKGITKITSPDWPGGTVLAMERNTFELCRKDSSTFPETAVYFLHTDRVTEEKPSELYIGESKNVNLRITQHQGSKDFWTHVVIATHRDLTKSHAKTVEAELIDRAMRANRYRVVNGNDGQPETLCDHDEKIVLSFIAGLTGMLELARYDFLIPSDTGLFEYQQKIRGERALRFKVRLINAAAREVLILIGSQIWESRNATPKEVVEAKLEGAGELRDDVWVFTKEVPLTLQGPLYRILGKSFHSFKSQNGVPLSQFLDDAQ